MKKSILIIMFIMAIINVSTIYARSYNISNSEEDGSGENPGECWYGWKEWHFGSTGVTTLKGDEVHFKKMMIQNQGKDISWHETTAITKGYGYFAYDLSKHMLGLLYYLKTKNLTYSTGYVPKYDVPVVYDEHGNDITNIPVNMDEAIKLTIEKLVRNWYSEDYEKNEFKDFWNNGIKYGDNETLRKLQNKFHWQVYAKETFKVLKDMMNIYGDKYYDKLTYDEKVALKGVVLSIMDARYRNKNLQGKANLSVKAAEGELWPFLVKLKNLEKIGRTESGGRYIYTDSLKKTTYYEFPPFDELIDGAYLWMKYYDSDVISDTTHSTVTNKIAEGVEGEEIEVDWDGEYYDLTRIPLQELNSKDLENFYNECYLVKSIFKKSKENSEGIFGAEELYDITSEVNISEAIANMKSAMQDFARKAEGTVGEIFNGLDSEHIARTYLMAKNIVETQRINDEYAAYNIGTNIITYTPGLRGDEYMLVDFQKIKLKAPLEIHDGEGIVYTKEDTDNDGIEDRFELGDEYSDSDKETIMTKKVDITGFVKKMVEKELYGNDEKMINENQDIVNKVLSQVKCNIYNNRANFDNENKSNNKINRKEDSENNLNLDNATGEKLDGLSNDTEKVQYLQLSPSKLEVELYKCKSNPVLKDTDFDGIEDGFGYKRDAKGEYLYDTNDEKMPINLNRYNDKIPKNNLFRGRMNSSRLSGTQGIEIDANMDYRYFFLSNKLYYDELSTMSLLYSNSIYMKGDKQEKHSGVQLKSINNLMPNIASESRIYKQSEVENMQIDNFNNMQVKQMMQHFGFKEVRTYYMGSPGDYGDENREGHVTDEIYLNYKDTHKGRVSVGYKNIEYHGLHKMVIGIVIRGTAEDDDWDSDFDMGDLDLRDDILKHEYGLLKEKVKSGFANKERNESIINSYLNSPQNTKYDHQYNTELAHFAYGYPDWTHQYHHAGFDIVANRILEVVKSYIKEVEEHKDDDIEDSDDNKVNNVVKHTTDYNDSEFCFWITGHSMGGGVANYER